jgi:hypothetical protein
VRRSSTGVIAAEGAVLVESYSMLALNELAHGPARG